MNLIESSIELTKSTEHVQAFGIALQLTRTCPRERNLWGMFDIQENEQEKKTTRQIFKFEIEQFNCQYVEQQAENKIKPVLRLLVTLEIYIYANEKLLEGR